MWNYEKLSTKLLVSSVKLIDTVGFSLFFVSFTQTTIKISLKSSLIDQIFFHFREKTGYIEIRKPEDHACFRTFIRIYLCNILFCMEIAEPVIIIYVILGVMTSIHHISTNCVEHNGEYTHRVSQKNFPLLN